MKTVREIYRRSLSLMGESEGENSAVFEEKITNLVNVLLAEIYDLDLALKGEADGVPSTVFQVASPDEEIWLEERLVFSLLPLGLASYLLGETEPERAAYFRELYRQERDHLRALSCKGRRHKIQRPY